MVTPGNQVAGSVEAGLERVITCWTVKIVAHVVFARPQKFYGRASHLGNVSAFDHVIVGQTPPETSAHAREVNGDVLLRDAQRFRHLSEAALRRLAGHPHFELAVLIMRGAVLRLERSVRDEWIRVVGFDNFRRAAQRGVGIAILAKRASRRLLGQFLSVARESFAALLRGLAFVPLHLQLLPSRARLPPTVPDNRDAAEQSRKVAAAFDDEGMPYPGHRFDFVDIRADNAAREHRTLLK